MKIYKITEASIYLGVSINTLKTLANNNRINSFKTTGEHRRFRQDDLDSYMGIAKKKKKKSERCLLGTINKGRERMNEKAKKTAAFLESRGKTVITEDFPVCKYETINLLYDFVSWAKTNHDNESFREFPQWNKLLNATGLSALEGYTDGYLFLMAAVRVLPEKHVGTIRKAIYSYWAGKPTNNRFKIDTGLRDLKNVIDSTMAFSLTL
jgi:excisionase family DNA binding protein